MTPEELQQIRERCERRNDSFDARDEFARHARTDVPALLDEVERLQKADDDSAMVVLRLSRELHEARAEVERLTRELQVERCGVRPIDELLERVTTDRDELHVAWKREREEVERLTRERDEARAKLRMCADSLQDLLKEYAKIYDEMERARASEFALRGKP